MHALPHSDNDRELMFDYKPPKGMVDLPQKPIPCSGSIFLPAEEIKGEFLGEMHSIQIGLEALLARNLAHSSSIPASLNQARVSPRVCSNGRG